MSTRFDHLVIGAHTLSQGVAYVHELLGVDIPKGGEHVTMGTHNHVMQLGDDTFLEVIAINPDATPPVRPRWFGLDDPAVQSSLRVQPRLLTWVVNNSSLSDTCMRSEFELGDVTPLSRNGLNWLFAVPADGRLLAGGMVPNIMQWQTSTHPASGMSDLGCRLVSLTIHHPYKDWLSSVLDGMQATHLVNLKSLTDAEAAYLSAEIETPSGMAVLNSTVPVR